MLRVYGSQSMPEGTVLQQPKQLVLDPTSVKTPASENENFPLVCEFTVKVPDAYKYDTQLAQFRVESADTKHCDPNLTDELFAKNVHTLVPGKSYTVHIYAIANPATTYLDCDTFITRNGGLRTGPEGLSLAWQQNKVKFPTDKIVLSFCNEHLVANNKDGALIHLLPGLYPTKTVLIFGLVLAKNDIIANGKFCLICLYEK